MNDVLKRRFNQLARREDEVLANGYGVPDCSDPYAVVVRDLLDILSPDPALTLLDVGCGTGEILRRLAPHFAAVKGIDLSPEMADRARAKGLDVIASSGPDLPFESECFDRVLIYQVIVNFASPEQARSLIREALRIVKSGGEVVIGATPHPNWSRFDIHRIPFLIRHHASRLMGRDPLSCFAFPVAFFAHLAEAEDVVRFEAWRNRVQLPNWDEKYDVRLVKG